MALKVDKDLVEEVDKGNCYNSLPNINLLTEVEQDFKMYFTGIFINKPTNY